MAAGQFLRSPGSIAQGFDNPSFPNQGRVNNLSERHTYRRPSRSSIDRGARGRLGATSIGAKSSR